MEPTSPFLEISGPESEPVTFPLTHDLVTIGRAGFGNDISLGPESAISRHHCDLVRRSSGWWLVKRGKTPPALRHGERWEKVGEEALLSDREIIGILAQHPQTRAYLYCWTIIFYDPERTVTVTAEAGSLSLKYEPSSGMLFRWSNKHKEEIPLSDLQRRLIEYMIGRNQQSGYPVLCKHKELLQALYESKDFVGYSRESKGYPFVPNVDNLRHHIDSLRGRIEPHPETPQFLVTYAGSGYILYTDLPLR